MAVTLYVSNSEANQKDRYSSVTCAFIQPRYIFFSIIYGSEQEQNRTELLFSRIHIVHHHNINRLKMSRVYTCK